MKGLTKKRLHIIAHFKTKKINGKYYLSGGFAKQIEELSKYFKEIILHVPLCDKIGFGGEIKSQNISIERIPKFSGLKGFLKKYFKLKNKVKQIIKKLHKNDICMVFIPGHYLGIMTAQILEKSNKKYFFRCVSDWGQEFKKRKGILRKVTSTLISPLINKKIKKILKNKLAFFTGYVYYKSEEKNHYAVVSSSITKEDIFHRTDACKKAPYKIIYVGRLTNSKGLDFLIKSAKLLEKENIDFSIKLIGEGCERKRLERLAKKIGVKNKVIFTGGMDFGKKLFDEYKKADILILPSLFESQGKTTIEAVAFGVPVIATNVGGVPTIVKNEYNGLLIKPKSSQEIKNAIIRLIKNKNLRERLISNGYKDLKKLSLKNQTEFMIHKIKEYFN